MFALIVGVIIVIFLKKIKESTFDETIDRLAKVTSLLILFEFLLFGIFIFHTISLISLRSEIPQSEAKITQYENEIVELIENQEEFEDTDLFNFGIKFSEVYPKLQQEIEKKESLKRRLNDNMMCILSGEFGILDKLILK